MTALPPRRDGGVQPTPAQIVERILAEANLSENEVATALGRAMAQGDSAVVGAIHAWMNESREEVGLATESEDRSATDWMDPLRHGLEGYWHEAGAGIVEPNAESWTEPESDIIDALTPYLASPGPGEGDAPLDTDLQPTVAEMFDTVAEEIRSQLVLVFDDLLITASHSEQDIAEGLAGRFAVDARILGWLRLIAGTESPDDGLQA